MNEEKPMMASSMKGEKKRKEQRRQNVPLGAEKE
jgi:hypothetical protein